MGLETIAIASLASAVIGGALSGVGSLASSHAQANAANYQAEVAKNNAKLAAWKAGQATKVGEQDLYNLGQQRRQRMGAIIAGEAAQGVDVNSGSALEVQQSEDILGQSEAQQLSERTGREVYGYRTQGVSYENEAQLEEYKSQQASEAGIFDVGTSLLGTASSVGGKYLDWQSVGGGSSASLY